MEEKGDDTTFYDANQTWTKILSKPDVLTICGQDLEDVATECAEEVYISGEGGWGGEKLREPSVRKRRLSKCQKRIWYILRLDL